MSTFNFSFSGDDIEDEGEGPTATASTSGATGGVESGDLKSRPAPANPAFPIPGKPLLPAQVHPLAALLASLPSKIAYGTLVVKLDDGSDLSIPRRELWDVRVQLMAEDDGGATGEDLGSVLTGKDDVKTGIYEGGFKSWESSVDVLKVLNHRLGVESWRTSRRILELGCGTALPSLALFQWLLTSDQPVDEPYTGGLDLGLADYNPTVLESVTLPNLILTWAQVTKEGEWEAEGEIDINIEVLKGFLECLAAYRIKLSFFSGAWSENFVDMVIQSMSATNAPLTIIGAETIYSPFALNSFAETLMALLDKLPGAEREALIGAKKVYFGVGGSIEDFCQAVVAKKGAVEQVREESDGVRRAIVRVTCSS